MATVYLARDEKLARSVALKVLSVEVGDPDVKRRFHLEARAIANLDHPNIIELFDYSDDDAPVLYLVMEYVPGLSTAHLLAERGPTSEQTALCIGHEIAAALEHAHTAGIVHRDIKPSNVLLHDGRVVLIDFGVMKVIDESSALRRGDEQSVTRPVGTPGFMAPEQFLGRKIDERTDVFAVGALLYNLVTDALPYHGTGLESAYDAVKRGRFTDPRALQPLLTVGFCELLADCVAADPGARLPSATALRQRIGALLEAHGVTDVRAELRTYEADPGHTATAQQARSADVLLRELKSALLRELQAATRDKDEAHAKHLVHQLRTAAQLEERRREDDGDTARHRVLRGSPRRRAAWILAGFFAGLLAAGGAIFGWYELGLPGLSETIAPSGSASGSNSTIAAP